MAACNWLWVQSQRLLPFCAHGVPLLVQQPVSLIIRVAFAFNARRTISGWHGALTTACTWLLRTLAAWNLHFRNSQVSLMALSIAARRIRSSLTGSTFIIRSLYRCQRTSGEIVGVP